MTEHDLTLPWRNDDPYPDVIVDSDGEEVASCSSNEDCDFIVKAANSHDALVNALTLAEDILSRAPFSNALWPNGMHPMTGITQIRDALALVKSQKQP